MSYMLLESKTKQFTFSGFFCVVIIILIWLNKCSRKFRNNLIIPER